MTTFYAWAIPANAIGSWADHTWVTTFDNRVTPYASLADVAAAKKHLWMCWGSFHPTGGAPGHPDGLLGSDTGDTAFAACLVLDNADSVRIAAARGTIHPYGIEGVCHQLANQVLFATASKMSVKGSRGYIKSVYVYGQYGRRRRAWAANIERCGEHCDIGAGMMDDGPDDFEQRAQDVLRDRNDLLGELMTMRQHYQAQLDELSGRADISAEEIDARHRAHMNEVAALLGPDQFEGIFQYDAAEEMNLVDPEILAASRGGEELSE